MSKKLELIKNKLNDFFNNELNRRVFKEKIELSKKEQEEFKNSIKNNTKIKEIEISDKEIKIIINKPLHAINQNELLKKNKK